MSECSKHMKTVLPNVMSPQHILIAWTSINFVLFTIIFLLYSSLIGIFVIFAMWFLICLTCDILTVTEQKVHQEMWQQKISTIGPVTACVFKISVALHACF